MPTALAVIQSAMGKINMLGAGDTVSAEDADVCLNELNTLIDSWQAEGMFCYTNVETTFTLPANTSSRTVGPGMQINIPRPDKIDRGCFSRIDDIDYPIDVIDSVEYSEISMKETSSLVPSVLNYDGGNPTGNIYFWPTTSQNVEIHIFTPEVGGSATSLLTNYVFPAGYQRAVEDNLAIVISPHFRVTPNPFLLGSAANSKRTLKRLYKEVPQLSLCESDDVGALGRITRGY